MSIHSASDWLLRPGFNTDYLGMLPDIFRAYDPRPAREQIEDRYAHGGGFLVAPGDWTMTYGRDAGEIPWAELHFPGDPPLKEIARLELSATETLVLFDCAFVAIVGPMLDFVVVRMD